MWVGDGDRHRGSAAQAGAKGCTICTGRAEVTRGLPSSPVCTIVGAKPGVKKCSVLAAPVASSSSPKNQTARCRRSVSMSSNIRVLGTGTGANTTCRRDRPAGRQPWSSGCLLTEHPPPRHRPVPTRGAPGCHRSPGDPRSPSRKGGGPGSPWRSVARGAGGDTGLRRAPPWGADDPLSIVRAAPAPTWRCAPHAEQAAARAAAERNGIRTWVARIVDLYHPSGKKWRFVASIQYQLVEGRVVDVWLDIGQERPLARASALTSIVGPETTPCLACSMSAVRRTWRVPRTCAPRPPSGACQESSRLASSGQATPSIPMIAPAQHPWPSGSPFSGSPARPSAACSWVLQPPSCASSFVPTNSIISSGTTHTHHGHERIANCS